MNRKVLTLAFVLFGLVDFVAVSPVSASNTPMQQFDKSTIIKKKLSDAQKYISKADYVAAQNTLSTLLKIDPNNSKAKELLKECESGIKKQKQFIKEEFINACNSGSISSLQEFINKYPNSEYVASAKKRIYDNNMWTKAKKQNTIGAYKDYLSQSTILAYKEEANEAIDILNSEIEWNNCKNSNNEDKLNAFISKYPKSPYIGQAKYRLNILTGEKYYTSNDYTLAYMYLNDADNFETLSGIPAQHLAALKEYREYQDVIQSSDVTKVKSFYSKLSDNSPYKTFVSNRLALLLGASLSTYSSDNSMEEALAYALDDDTRSQVKQYISKAKTERAYYERQRKAYARKAWWKDRFMIGWNIAHFDYLDDIMSCGTGVKFRLGRWSDVVNFLFGAEYSYVMYLDSSADMYWEDQTTFTVTHAIEVPVGLRLNLIKVGSRSRIYLGCNAAFGFNLLEGDYFKNSTNKQTLSIGPQIGIAGRGYDFGIYYKKYLEDKTLFKHSSEMNQRIGCFITWFI